MFFLIESIQGFEFLINSDHLKVIAPTIKKISKEEFAEVNSENYDVDGYMIKLDVVRDITISKKEYNRIKKILGVV